MRIILLGCTGQLGRCLNDQLKHTNYEVIYTSRSELDITDFEEVRNFFLEACPDIIINATAYTAVDKAESSAEIANIVNHLAVRNIADICNQLDCWLIHISTDYVFDGDSSLPYVEDDFPNPKCVYGETKLNGELAIKKVNAKHIILRTSWVYSEYGNNFLNTMLNLASQKSKVSIVDDQFGCPTYAQDIAKAIVNIMTQLNLGKSQIGIYHFCGDTVCSWFDFAKEIFKQLDTFKTHEIPILKSIKSKDYPTAAKRPKYSVLNNIYISKKFNISASQLKPGILSSINNQNKNDKI